MSRRAQGSSRMQWPSFTYSVRYVGMQGPYRHKSRNAFEDVFGRTITSLLQKGQHETQELVALCILQLLYTEYCKTRSDRVRWRSTGYDCGCQSNALATKQCIHIALRLFIAASGSFDPLMRVYYPRHPSKTEDETSHEEDFMAAQAAVQQATWEYTGVSNSAQYLQSLFQDEREDLLREALDIAACNPGLNVENFDSNSMRSC